MKCIEDKVLVHKYFCEINVDVHAPLTSVCSLPLMPRSGKVDKKALVAYHTPDLMGKNITEMCTTETEKTLALLWSDTLCNMTLDLEESFFDLGGYIVYILLFVDKYVLNYQSFQLFKLFQ